MVKNFDEVCAEALGAINGGLVLDVGTGRGGNLHTLNEHLDGWDTIVAVDLDPEALAQAREKQQQKGMLLAVADAALLPCADEAFDTVAISASLHHLTDCPIVLGEMLRVVAESGHVIVIEMHRENETEAQATMMMLHDWAGEIDTARGIHHGPSKTRAEILALVEQMGLVNVVVRDFGEPTSDPHDEEFVGAGLGAISRYMPRMEGLTRRVEFERRGEALRKRLAAIGVQSQPGVVITGRKGPALGDRGSHGGNR